MSTYEEKTKICPSCQREIDYYDATCGHCYHRFDLGELNPRAVYIKENSGAYLKRFGKLEAKGGKTGWNWYAFLLSPSWMFYRKMYKIGFLFLLIPTVVEWLSCLAFLTDGIVALLAAILDFVVMVGFWIAGGLYGDYWYMQKIDDLVREGEELPPEGKAALAEREGGTSMKMVFAGLALAAICALITTALEGMVGL